MLTVGIIVLVIAVGFVINRVEKAQDAKLQADFDAAMLICRLARNTDAQLNVIAIADEYNAKAGGKIVIR